MAWSCLQDSAFRVTVSQTKADLQRDSIMRLEIRELGYRPVVVVEVPSSTRPILAPLKQLHFRFSFPGCQGNYLVSIIRRLRVTTDSNSTNVFKIAITILIASLQFLNDLSFQFRFFDP